ALVERDLDVPGAREAGASHDELGPARLVGLEMALDQPFDHLALAPPDLGHVHGDATGHGSEAGAIARQLGDLGAPDLVLAGQAIDVGAGATDPAPFHHGRAPAGLAEMPGDELAALAAADHERVVAFRFSHGCLHPG